MASVVDDLGESVVAPGFGDDGVDGLFDIDGQQYDVRTGTQGADGTLAVLIGVANGLHINAIGEYQTVKAHLFAQQGVHDALRK